MCGIAGFLGSGDEATLRSMCDALSRRGPNDHGTFSGGGVGLSHTRLAIIDLSAAGHQPMKSDNAVIAFNGEIYNYRELRETLSSRYRFKTESDTEVILALYETEGAGGFSKLDGMFAFALYDTRSATVHLARDRFGKKPLYWGIFNGVFLFGSELKALMRHGAFSGELDHEAVADYVTFEYVPTPRSIFRDVHKLEPASYLAYKTGGDPVITRFWEPRRDPIDDSFETARSRTDDLLRTAVQKRLVSDVPLGVFLSGGIDSSAVAYYARELGEVKTFSIGFDDPDFDESAHARSVAAALGTAHAEERFSSHACADIVPEVYSYLDEPIADASILPTYLLSGFTRKHVTVALGGDGGDEVFAGYPTFQAEALAGAYRSVPRVIRDSVIAPLVHALPSSDSNLSLDFKLKRFVDGAAAEDHERHQRWLGAFTDDRERASLLVHKETTDRFEPHRAFFRANGSRRDHLNDLLWSYMRSYLMDEVLVKVDRASMAHGLEVRTPFLDTALNEYVLRLPYSYKYGRFTCKRLLKAVMRGKLPDSIIDRPKKGFGIPLTRWLRTDLNTLMHEVLSPAELRKSGVFQVAAVERLIAEHEAGHTDHRKKLWTLMTFQMWHNAWKR